MEFITSFRKSQTPIERTRQAIKLLKKYPLCVPIIIDHKGKNTPKLSLNILTVNRHCSFIDFCYRVKKLLPGLKSNEAVLIMFGAPNQPKIIPLMNDTIGSIHNMYRDEDNFLYGTVQVEDAYG